MLSSWPQFVRLRTRTNARRSSASFHNQQLFRTRPDFLLLPSERIFVSTIAGRRGGGVVPPLFHLTVEMRICDKGRQKEV